ncbi:MAG TPA: sigma 54-interacting transcriptional regulator [Gemmatimonadales bacterium]|nr:sigma 54-interacting transcriptional regulator [Gemmatimonadales bacterium]
MGTSADPIRAESNADADAARQAPESLLLAARRTLEMIAVGASMADILTNLCAAIDAQSPDIISTILLADPDGRHLRPVAGPRVPRGWAEAITPLTIGPDIGSCGTAAYLKERVIISDIASDPRWSSAPPSQSRDVAMSYGLRAAWSEPLISKDNELLGTFAMYYGSPRTPSTRDLRLIADAAQIALIAIEGQRSQAALRTALRELESSEREAREIVDAIPQTIVVLSPDGAALYANRSVLAYTGLTIDEVMGAGFRTRAFHPEDVARLQDQRREGLARGVPFELELRARRHDGQYRWFLVQYNPVRDEQGRTLRWYATGTDIEDRKRAAERMRNENLALREDIDRSSMFEEIVGSSPALQRVLAQVAKVANTDSTVLILGETGTGKELVARAIHKRSRRSSRAFIRVNCPAIPASLIASELFGHEKGAFTGALQRRLGRFEAADGGTIFLDEIGELPSETQIALLRVLQEREIERLGSHHPIAVDVRVVAATNRDLEAAVERGGFRQDLFYRLNVFPIRIPPLRERVDDIPVLAQYLIERYAKQAGKSIRTIRKQTLELLQAYDWPGNVRELQNVIERAVILCEGETFAIDESWLKGKPSHAPIGTGRQVTTLAEGERALIIAALAESRGRVSGQSGAAAKLGVPRQTLESKIKALHIDTLAFRDKP